jgi:hypothetical protein
LNACPGANEWRKEVESVGTRVHTKTPTLSFFSFPSVFIFIQGTLITGIDLFCSLPPPPLLLFMVRACGAGRCYYVGSWDERSESECGDRKGKRQNYVDVDIKNYKAGNEIKT